MTSTPHPFRIVVGIDFSEPSRLALAQAATMAAAWRGELHPVHVVDDAPDPLTGRTDTVELDRRFRDAADRAKHFIDSEMTMLSQRLGPSLEDCVVFHVRAGAPAAQVVALAQSLDADLIVVATHGLRGFARFVMGSVSERLLRLAHCPVLVVRPKEHPEAAQTVEPPCPDCVQIRSSSDGSEMWCERHRDSHLHAHRFSYTPVAPVKGSMTFDE